MKKFVFLAFLIIYGKCGQSKNLDEIGDASTSSVSSTTTGLPAKEQKLPISTSVVTANETTSTPATSTTEESSWSQIQNLSQNSSSIVIAAPGTNVSFIDNLSNQIRLVLKHFQDPDPIGLPGSNILPEPMAAENVNASLVVATGFFNNITIYGLNNFSIGVVNTFLDKMEVYVIIRLKTVTALGNYSIDGWLGGEGPFNITFINVTAAGVVGLAINEEGKLYANKSNIDIAYEQVEVELTNVSTFVKPFLNSGGSSVFDAEKPLILENINQRLISEMNRRLEPFPKIPPLVKLSPVDLAVLEARKYVKRRHEPFIIDKVFDFDNAFLTVHVGPVNINGLSKFSRVGNITLSMVNQTVDLRIRIITQKLVGSCKWYYDIGKVGVTRHGESNFSISHLQFEARVLQSVDSRKSPKLEELEIETGPIYIKMDGRGSFDYLVEMVSKILPKMLRHMIIDALEEPVKEKIQTDVLDKISVEQVYEENLPDIKKYLSDKI